jgi:hypothetical protein
MALAAAVTAANLYYCQPLLSEIARSLHMTARESADIPILTQVGYALGLLFFAPLGDTVERRALATALLLIVTVSLLGTSFAPDAWVLMATSLMSGMFSVVPQVHYGAQMVEPLRFCRRPRHCPQENLDLELRGIQRSESPAQGCASVQAAREIQLHHFQVLV